MKKFLFAVQVFGLIAILPLYVVFEMNHGTPSSKAAGSTPVSIEKKQVQPVEPGNSLVKYPVAALLLGQLAIKGTPKCDNKTCSCQDCTCGGNCTCIETPTVYTGDKLLCE